MPPEAGSLALVLEAYVPPDLTGQWLEVTLQGNTIARLDATDLKKRRHIITLGDDVPRGEALEVGFTLGKTFKPERDSRHLSILFSYIGLVPHG